MKSYKADSRQKRLAACIMGALVFGTGLGTVQAEQKESGSIIATKCDDNTYTSAEDIKIKGDKAPTEASANANNGLTGVEANNGSVELTGNEIDIEAKSDEKNTFAVMINHPSKESHITLGNTNADHVNITSESNLTKGAEEVQAAIFNRSHNGENGYPLSKVTVLAKNINIAATTNVGTVNGVRTGYNSETYIGDSNTEMVTISAESTSSLASAVSTYTPVDDCEAASAEILGKNINLTAVSKTASALGVFSTDKSNLTIGDASTENVTINVEAAAHVTGIYAAWAKLPHANSIVEVYGKELNITAVGGTQGEGIWANGGYADAETPVGTAEIIVNTENSTINANTHGIYNIKKGRVEINGNTEIEAPTAVYTYGSSQTTINADADKTVKITGDIYFDGTKSGYTPDSEVYINLTGGDSYLNGNIYSSSDEARAKVEGMKLRIADGANWNTDTSDKAYDYSFVNDLELDGGLINVNDTGETVYVDTSTGMGTVNMKATGTGSNISTGKFKVQEAASTGRIDFNYDGINADDVAEFDDLYNLVHNSIYVNDDSSLLAVANVEEGLINGAISTETENHMTGNTIKLTKTPSTTIEDISSTAALGILGWREEDVILSQRMGDVREANGDEGPWARFSRGEFEYGGEFKNIHNFLQVGYDWVDHDDNWHYGLAVSHNRGKSSYRLGTGEDRSTSLLLYGARLMENGEYYDLTAKIGRLSNEYDVYAKAGHTHGDYDTWGTAFGWEYGRRYQKENGWFIQPLGKITVSNINGVDYDTANGIHVSQDHLTSVLGRLGFEAGKKDGKNNFYVKGFVLHEFGDSVDTSYTYGKLTNSYSAPLGNTWYELGLGGNVKLSEDTYLYADVVRTYGDDFRTPWKWNVGVNYSF